MSLLNKKAPTFTSTAVLNGKEVVRNFSLEQYIGDKYVVLFFYPKDFSSLCPTELWAFQEKLTEFEEKEVAVIACSTDTEETHLAWLNTSQENGGIEGITYPLIADVDKTISTAFDVLAGEYDYDDDGNLVFDGIPVALRGSFLIDKEGVIQHIIINHLPVGRNIPEMLRMVDAVKNVQENGELCPANWKVN